MLSLDNTYFFVSFYTLFNFRKQVNMTFFKQKHYCGANQLKVPHLCALSHHDILVVIDYASHKQRTYKCGSSANNVNGSSACEIVEA